MSTGAKNSTMQCLSLAETPKVDSCAQLHVSIFPNFCRTEDDFEPWLLEDKMSSYSTKSCHGITMKQWPQGAGGSRRTQAKGAGVL